WRRIGGGDGMYVQVDPRDDRTTYLGLQFGFYFRMGKGPRRPVRPRDALGEPALRYNWSSPILLSEHNADILYFGANKLYRSLDQGESWQAISEDLSRSEMRGDVPFGTLTTLAESSLEFGLLWAGTDDGYLHVTDDGGREWREVSGSLPKDRWVTRVEASRFARDRAYASLSGYRDDDIAAYLYVTEDLGATWTSLADGLPAEAINVVREDPVNEEVLYVGTDRGAYVSLDRGATWQALPGNLPNVPVHDLIVHPRERELVAGTHGRSIYILDVLPIQELSAEVRDSPVHLFSVEDVAYDRSWRSRRSPWFRDPTSEPTLEIPFWSAADGQAELFVRDSEGRDLRRLELAAKRGINTFTWDLLLDESLAQEAETAALAEETEGDEAPRGKKKRGKAKTEEKADAEASTKGRRAKTPWAEAVRLDRPLYVTPGSYSLVVRTAGGEAQTELMVSPPEPRPPRMPKEPKIRGQKD
ncbi:MAG: glycosyl hydrolase, partial [Acidobacteriota bacterium]